MIKIDVFICLIILYSPEEIKFCRTIAINKSTYRPVVSPCHLKNITNDKRNRDINNAI